MTRFGSPRRLLFGLLLVAPASAIGSWFSTAEEEQVDKTVLVSPIVRRELEASVVAHSWPSTVHNVFCEAWAYHQQTNGGAWSFLDALVDKLHQTDSETTAAAEATRLVLESSTKHSMDQSLLQYALAMRAYSPQCELHRGLARRVALETGLYRMGSNVTGLDAFAVVYPGGRIVTNPEADWSSSTEHAPLPPDLLLPGETPRDDDSSSSANEGRPLVVLYANMGSQAFAAFYSKLVAEEVNLVVRHLGAIAYEEQGGGQPTVLQGYGVRLDIRNVEYRAFDDMAEGKKTTDESMLNVTTLETVVPHILAGINVSSLADGLSPAQALELQAQLWKQHEATQLHAQIVPPKWQRRQLPLQATAVVAAARDKDALLTLQDVSQNLPSLASTLVHVQVPEEVEIIAESMEEMLRHQGNNLLMVNGRPIAIDQPTFNVFKFLKLLKEEQGELQQLEQRLSPYMNREALKQVQRAWMMGADALQGSDDDEDEAPSSVFRIDVGRGWKQAVIYLNDVEKDPRYENWPRQLKQMLFGMQFGQPPAVRRNLFTILAVVDPLSNQENPGLNLGRETMQGNYPVRVGVLLVNNDDMKACAEWTAANDDVDEDTPCPVAPIFESGETPDLSQLEEMEATAQAVHRLFSYVSIKFAGNPLLMAYSDYLLPMIEEHMEMNGNCSMYALVEMHAKLMEGMGVVRNHMDGMSDALQALTKKEEDSDEAPLYGKALRFALNKSLQPGMSFLNGRALPLSTDENKREKIGSNFMEEQSYLFGLIMKDEITDTSPKSIYAKLLTGAGVFKKVHPLLTASKGNKDAYIQMVHNFGDDSLLFPKSHVESTKDKALAVFVVDVVLELDTSEGLDMASKFISMMDEFPSSLGDGDDGTAVSVGYRFLPSTRSSAASIICPLLRHASHFDKPDLLALLSAAMAALDGAGDRALEEMVEKFNSTLQSDRFSGESASSCTELPYLKNELPSTNFIVGNGLVYSPEDTSYAKEDVELLLSLDQPRVTAVTRLLKPHLSPEESGYHDAISQACVFLAQQQSGSKRVDVEAEVISLEQAQDLEENPLRFVWNDDSNIDADGFKVKVTAVVDPLSEATQRVAPLLRVVRDQLKLPLSLVLAPATSGGDDGIPITSFYRFVADPLASPDVNPPKAYFANLPANHVLTLQMDVPEPWNVQQMYAVQDTDNLRCDVHSGCGDDANAGKLDSDVPVHEQKHLTRVEYGLSGLMFFGQCYDATKGSPPNGLQLTLTANNDLGLDVANLSSKVDQVEIGPDGTTIPAGSSGSIAASVDGHHYSDTLVMKTVGYWQLRANPGVWKLGIAKDSRGAEIFDMVDGTVQYGRIKVNPDAASNNATKTLVMKDFVNHGELLVVKRRPGWEKATLFYDAQDKAEKDEDEVIHVFSLATGHLYERLLKIMMLSVTKRTSSKVKFWLFENFLSPSFKVSAIAMAEQIGCEVEFVTYKWPEWLRGQSEKQRIIWGYKILFLDVLFPLNVKKIIYVDADQVVRADLKELWDLDLEGAPYGYTPMCDSRETTLGFQFWQTGFWKSHLRGKPYHISALYVVDLEKFRQDLVGDQLRSIYQQLSADPGSLANLDQDLPNYAQHQVPIYSLPQEWLWCESWCSDETKPSAKTIDLCNNPLHKENKVSMAKRIISGELFKESWVELDAEVERYEKEFSDSLSS